MKTVAVQYLEDGPDLAATKPREARERLRCAFDLLPISYVLLGWSVPPAVVDVCRVATDGANAELYTWHPLLTGDGVLTPQAEWQTVGLDGGRLPGYQARPEFTFLCPNRPQVREAVLSRLYSRIRGGEYQGVFLDRIRYPSPASDPGRLLACLCEDCHRAAKAEGLDLEILRQQLATLLLRADRVADFVRALLDPRIGEALDPALSGLGAFMAFRARSVSRLVEAAVAVIHGEGLAVGLDCFSPALAYAAGQDLRELGLHGEWIKIMSYGHTLGPAGLPFELLNLAGWLVGERAWGEFEALELLSSAARLPLARTRSALQREGLGPKALTAEVRRARAAIVGTLLAGIELVEIDGVTNLTRGQIADDLDAFRCAGADGLVLSWDLWHIPLRWLELVQIKMQQT